MFFPQTASNAASRTYTVQQGTVRIQVSGTGNVVAANLAFANDRAALAANVQYQTDKRQLVFDQGQLTIAQAQFNADGCATAPLPFTGTCLTDFNAVKAAQATVNADAARLPLDQA